MLAEFREQIPNRLLILAILGLLYAFPVTAQTTEVPTKGTSASSADPSQTADVQDPAAQEAKQQGRPAAAPTTKRNASSSARPAGSGAAKSSSATTVKNAASAPAEPELPIVPPPPQPSQETSTSTTAAVTDPHSAAGPATDNVETFAQTQGPGWVEMARTIGSVGLILCLIVGGYMLFKKFAPQYVTRHSSERDIRLVETLSLGEKRSVVVVQAGAQRFLLGCTPGQITLLTALNASGGTATVGGTDIVESQAAAVFPGNFKSLYEQEKKAPPPRPSALKALPPDIRGKMSELRKALEG